MSRRKRSQRPQAASGSFSSEDLAFIDELMARGEIDQVVITGNGFRLVGTPKFSPGFEEMLRKGPNRDEAS